MYEFCLSSMQERIVVKDSKFQKTEHVNQDLGGAEPGNYVQVHLFILFVLIFNNTTPENSLPARFDCSYKKL